MITEANRLVYIGGFGSNPRHSRIMTDNLTEYYSGHHGLADLECIAYTSTEADDDPDGLAMAADGACLVTHSGGLRVPQREGMKPREIIAAGPPMPMTTVQLVALAGLKTVHSVRHTLRSDGQFGDATVHNLALARWMLKYPREGYRQLAEVSRLDGLATLTAASRAGILATAVLMSEEKYFTYPSYRTSQAERAGVRVARAAGAHDEIIFDTAAVLDTAYDRHDA